MRFIKKRKQKNLRQHDRHEIHVHVMLHYAPMGLIRGEARDVSDEGVFVHTGHVALPRNAEVEMIFSLPGLRVGEPYRIHAVVVHSAKGGCGLKALESSHEGLRALQQALSSAA